MKKNGKKKEFMRAKLLMSALFPLTIVVIVLFFVTTWIMIYDLEADMKEGYRQIIKDNRVGFMGDFSLRPTRIVVPFQSAHISRFFSVEPISSPCSAP